MGSQSWKDRIFLALPIVVLAMATGCEQTNPNAPNIEAPIVTADAPQSSEEAAEQSEPPPIEHKGRGRKAR